MLRWSKKRNQYESSNMIVAADDSYSMSYGWYYMHRTFKLGKQFIRVLNSCSYSNTTSKHFSKLYKHVGYNFDLKVYDPKGLTTVKGMIKAINGQIQDSLELLNKPRVRKTTKEQCLSNIEQLYKNLQIVRKLKEV